MGSLETACLDLECGGGYGSSAVSKDCKEEKFCFLKAEENPCSSQSYLATYSLNQGHDSDSEIVQISHSRRASSVVATDCVVDVDQNSVDEVRISVGTTERECRICMSSLDSESGIAIESGCSCKNELAAVHQQCAETWFRSKGNRICEICKSIAKNVDVPNYTKSWQQNFEVNRISTDEITVPVSGRSASLTYASSDSEFEANTFSRNAVFEPVSSTSYYGEIGRILFGCVFMGLMVCILVLSLYETR